MQVSRGIPAYITKKAQGRLSEYMSGELHARQLAGNRGAVLYVTHRYRLLCRDTEHTHDPEKWALMSHESYNRYAI